MEANINSDEEHSDTKGKTMNKDSSSSVTDSEDDDKRKRTASGTTSTKKALATGSGTTSKSCQAELCTADLSGARTYHRRHKVCELHAKAPVVPVAGLRQRFCQQCSRFHELSEFDDTKRSCRRRLAGHNERRRKNFGENNHPQAADGSAGDRNLQFAVQENANYNHFNVTR